MAGAVEAAKGEAEEAARLDKARGDGNKSVMYMAFEQLYFAGVDRLFSCLVCMTSGRVTGPVAEGVDGAGLRTHLDVHHGDFWRNHKDDVRLASVISSMVSPDGWRTTDGGRSRVRELFMTDGKKNVCRICMKKGRGIIEGREMKDEKAMVLHLNKVHSGLWRRCGQAFREGRMTAEEMEREAGDVKVMAKDMVKELFTVGDKGLYTCKICERREAAIGKEMKEGKNGEVLVQHLNKQHSGLWRKHSEALCAGRETVEAVVAAASTELAPLVKKEVVKGFFSVRKNGDVEQFSCLVCAKQGRGGKWREAGKNSATLMSHLNRLHSHLWRNTSTAIATRQTTAAEILATIK